MLREDELNHSVHGVARVNLHQKKRNTFYKLGYNENHIPALNKKKRKPRFGTKVLIQIHIYKMLLRKINQVKMMKMILGQNE